jgi:hypothetical protein
MLNRLVLLWMLLFVAAPASAQVSVGVSFANVSIGINLPVYPELVPVPGYPVYYAPRMDSNYFFYDGMYWVFQGDAWYASTWYNGPWQLVDRDELPVYLLRVPVRYYRQPPGYFRGWQSSAPPRWGEHWGNDWAQRRSGWDQWNHNSAPAPAPLPAYQRSYAGDRYPAAAQQQTLQSKNYRYQPRDAVVRQHYQAQAAPAAATPAAPTPATVAPAPAQGAQRQAPNSPPQEREAAQRKPPEAKSAGEMQPRPVATPASPQLKAPAAQPAAPQFQQREAAQRKPPEAKPAAEMQPRPVATPASPQLKAPAAQAPNPQPQQREAAPRLAPNPQPQQHENVQRQTPEAAHGQGGGPEKDREKPEGGPELKR